MELLDELKAISKAEDFLETKNYYYEYHLCKATGKKEKVQLDFILSNELTDKILKFGFCKECNLCIYHYDYNSKNF